MISKKDMLSMDKMEKNWLNFVNARNKRMFEKETGKNWLTMLERERMISEFVRIFQNIKNKVVYE